MDLAQIFKEVQIDDDGIGHTAIPATWHQGRTCYGGLSTVLAYQQALSLADDLPQLCSGQVAFVGPLFGEVSITAQLLRRGKNSAFVCCEISGEQGVGLIANFVFMQPRVSHLAFDLLTSVDLPPVPSGGNLRSGPEKYFTANMEFGDGRNPAGRGKPLVECWARLKGRSGLNDITQLLAVADALPSAAVGMMTEYGPVSSLTWQFNLLDQQATTEEGWWYLQSSGISAANGISSQDMTCWNAAGQPVMKGMQSIAIFA